MHCRRSLSTHLHPNHLPQEHMYIHLQQHAQFMQCKPCLLRFPAKTGTRERVRERVKLERETKRADASSVFGVRRLGEMPDSCFLCGESATVACLSCKNHFCSSCDEFFHKCSDRTKHERGSASYSLDLPQLLDSEWYACPSYRK